MSKKKATMTLKDFHGGSIPSDLRLPSAPGASVRPVDRSGFDRQMSWGSSAGRPEHRVRPISAGSSRNLDEKAPFLSPGSLIGRNFDEDERKPLDGLPGLRRPIVDESARAQPSRPAEPKLGSRAVSTPATSYGGRVTDVPNVRLNYPTPGGNSSYGSNYPVMGSNSGQAMAGSYPNAWGARKETASSKEPVPVAFSSPDGETKLALASALEKVSSGRWNSKQRVHSPRDAKVPPVLEENISSEKSHDNHEVLGNPGHGIEVPSPDKVSSTAHLDSHERNSSVAVNGLHSVVLSESSERPRLKLLPRSKPIEAVEPAADFKQTRNQPHVADSYAVHDSKISFQYGDSGPVVIEREPERAKLNLKPQSQTTEYPEGKNDSKRGTVFRGARPRELVLKERGVEDDISSYESRSPLRVKAAKAGTPTHLPPARHNEKAETDSVNRRAPAKYPERPDKSDPHRRYRPGPSEIRKNSRQEVDKNWNQVQKQQERTPSPETWRKPMDPAGPGHPSPAHHGKVASAVELVQAFSKSLPGEGQVPFSRLLGPTSRARINGY